MKLKYAWRSLRAGRDANVPLVGVVAIGLALATTMFVLASPYVLKSLPYARAADLAIMRLVVNGAGGDFAPDLAPTLADWRRHSDLFERLAAVEDGQQFRRIRTSEEAVLVRVRAVSDDFFEVLGVPIRQMGPWKLSEGTGGSVESFVVLSGSPFKPGDAAARSYVDTQNGESVQIAGYVPDRFIFPEPQVSRRPDAVYAAVFDRLIDRRGAAVRAVQVIGRLREGVTIDAVRSRLASSLRATGFGIQVDRLDDHMTKAGRPLGWAALAAGLLVICACAANAANLLAIRTSHRTREYAIRVVLGATRKDLSTQFAIEVGILAATSVAVSLFLAQMALAAIVRVVPAQYLAIQQPDIDGWAVVFAIMLCVMVSCCAAAAAWVSVRSRRRGASIAVDPGCRLRWLRMAAIFGQTSVTMLLLVGAVLLVRSSAQIWSQASGFSGSVAVATVSYPPQLGPERLAQTIERTVAGLEASGSEPAAALVGPFLDESGLIGGYSITMAGRRVALMPREVTPRYFETVGAKFVAGRSLEDFDKGWTAVVIDQTLSRKLWPDRPFAEVVGETIMVASEKRSGHVVGVVQDMYDKAFDRAPVGTLFRPLTRPLDALPVNVMLRLSDPSSTFRDTIRRAVTAAHHDAVVGDVDLLDRRLGDTVQARSFTTLILVCFSVAAIGVTATGLFGVVGFVVVRRTREIAIRRALGAVPKQILRVVGGETVAVAASGTSAGLVTGYLGSRLLTHHLYRIEPHDPLSMAVAALLMIFLVAVASISAARRALTIQPSEALRLD